MATIKQIAYLAGVSRGTVDRVLNRRGHVNTETETKVLSIVEALGYSPNRLGKNLSIRKKGFRFGYILFGSVTGNPFFEDMLVGIRHKVMELEQYGIEVEVLHTALDDPMKQVALMDDLVAKGANGIALTPIQHPLVEAKINELADKGIPVITANSDLENSKRLAYVGSDGLKGGRTAAGLLCLITGGKSNIGIVMGSKDVRGHVQRVQGFSDYVEENYPDMHIADIVTNNDDDLESYDETLKMLQNHPEIDSIFLVSGGVRGTCRAVQSMNLAGKLRIVSFDMVPYTRKMIKEGVIYASIGQQPEVQGGKPLDILLDYLGMDTPPLQEKYFTQNEIKIRENLL
ncbi:LacI family DNA-binding transcriptional regulator [Oscillospiraceae bacterium MB08-C2-2]|nr:LacI family DNA-binding transcriptional regulator [Oscillospiraceae bacterium MB08-C2-2]